QWQVQPDVARELGGEGGVLGEDLGERRDQQHVVEGQRFSEKAHSESSKKRIVPACNFARRGWGKAATERDAAEGAAVRRSYTEPHESRSHRSPGPRLCASHCRLGAMDVPGQGLPQ